MDREAYKAALRASHVESLRHVPDWREHAIEILLTRCCDLHAALGRMVASETHESVRAERDKLRRECRDLRTVLDAVGALCSEGDLDTQVLAAQAAEEKL